MPSTVLHAMDASAATEAVTSGGLFDYQPSGIRSTDDGARIVAFERPDPGLLPC